MVTFPMTLTELDFQGHCIFKVEYLKYRAFYGQSFYRTLIGNHSQSIECYHFQWPWLTSDANFKVTTYLKSDIGKTAHLENEVSIAQEQKYPAYW